MLLSKLDTMVEWLQVCAFLNPGLPLIAYPTWESYFSNLCYSHITHKKDLLH